jgi:hypothetical protein
MFRSLLEKQKIVLNDIQYKEVLEATTDDIKFNNISFKRRTSLSNVITIAQRVAVTLKRCEVDTCQVCGCNIFEHEEYYDIYGILICRSCIKDYKKGGC